MREMRLFTSKTYLSSLHLQFLAALAIFIALALVTLEPNPSYMAADDFFVMPERLWFVRHDFEWLYHLLNFSQHRLTNTGGDFSGLRPVPYLLWWVEDMIGREFRNFYHYLCVATGIAWTATTYLLLRRYVGFVASTLIAAILLISPVHDAYTYFMSWPELNAYGIALLLFNVGLLLLSTDERVTSAPGLVVAISCFVIAGLNHEFVIPALLVMTSFYAAWNWHMHRLGQSSPGSWKTFLVVGCAFVILSAVVLVHFMLAEFVEPPHWATLQPMLLSLYRLCALIAMPLLPQVIGDYARVIVPITAMVSVAGLFAFGLLAIDQKRIWARMQEPVVVGAISACLAIVGAVFVGRIITDGYISPWYYRFLSAYEAILLAAGTTLVVVRHKKIVGIIFAGFAAYFVFGYADQIYLIRSGNESIHRSDKIEPVIWNVRRELQAHPQWCFAGVWPRGFGIKADFEPRPREMTLDNPAAVAAISSVLQFYSCAERAGSPTYFATSSNEAVGLVHALAASPKVLQSVPRSSSAMIGGAVISFPAPLYEILGPNIQDYRKRHESHPYGTIEWDGQTRRDDEWRGQVIANIDGDCPCDIRMSVQSRDSFPRMYNLGLIFDYGQPNAAVLLLFENQVVFGHLQDGQLRITSLGFIPDMRASLELVVRSDKDGCMVFGNEQLLASDENCALTAGKFGTFSWLNGTPAEWIARLTIAANAREDPALVPLQ